MSRRKPVLKNRMAPEIEAAVVDLATEQPTWGQVRVANELRKQALMISPAGVRCVWQRHDVENTKKRLKVLEAKMAQDGRGLTDAQVAALEKARSQKQAYGEFESECPGYCGAQDTFYVGTLKGVRPHLPADVHRHLLESGLRQALRPEDADHGGGSAQRPCRAILR